MLLKCLNQFRRLLLAIGLGVLLQRAALSTIGLQHLDDSVLRHVELLCYITYFPIGMIAQAYSKVSLHNNVFTNSIDKILL